MSAKPFRRKDLKHDEFINFAGRVGRWLMERRRRIGWGLLAIAAVLSVVLSVRFYQQREEQRAAVLLAAAMDVYRAPVVPPLPVIPVSLEDPAAATDPTTEGNGAEGAQSAEGAVDEAATDPTAAAADPTAGAAEPVAAAAEPVAEPRPSAGALQFGSEAEKYTAARDRFTPIVELYGRRPSGRLAAFYLGICEAELGETEAAAVALEQAADAAEPVIASMALNRLGQLELQRGNADVAVTYFDALLTRSGGLFPRDEAMMAKARAQQESGDLRAALATYQRVLDEFVGSYSAAEARTHVEELSAQLGLNPNVEGL